MRKMLAIILFAAGSASTLPATAAPSGATMLTPGVYTTADISRRCQTYTNRRVRGGGMDDTSRQAVFIACVQKLYNQEHGGDSLAAAPAPAPAEGFVEAPVALPQGGYGGYDPYGYGGNDRASSPYAGGGGA